MKTSIRIKRTVKLVTSQIKPLHDINRSLSNNLSLLILRCKVIIYRWKLKTYVRISSTRTEPPEYELGTVSRKQPILSP